MSCQFQFPTPRWDVLPSLPCQNVFDMTWRAVAPVWRRHDNAMWAATGHEEQRDRKAGAMAGGGSLYPEAAEVAVLHDTRILKMKGKGGRDGKKQKRPKIKARGSGLYWKPYVSADHNPSHRKMSANKAKEEADAMTIVKTLQWVPIPSSLMPTYLFTQENWADACT